MQNSESGALFLAHFCFRNYHKLKAKDRIRSNKNASSCHHPQVSLNPEASTGFPCPASEGSCPQAMALFVILTPSLLTYLTLHRPSVYQEHPPASQDLTSIALQQTLDQTPGARSKGQTSSPGSGLLGWEHGHHTYQVALQTTVTST